MNGGYCNAFAPACYIVSHAHEQAAMENANDTLRIDKWLWAARFYKTRALASEAVSGGKVHVNDQRARPSRPLRVGDTLLINRGEVEFTVVVEALSGRRGPALEARALYRETEESLAQRERAASERRLRPGPAPAPQGRPNKRDRRLLLRMRGI